MDNPRELGRKTTAEGKPAIQKEKKILKKGFSIECEIYVGDFLYFFFSTC